MCGRKISTLGCALRRRLSAHSSWTCGGPIWGCALGHQLLADAIGGKVGPAKTPEIGVLTISKTEQGNLDPMFQGISDPMLALQWHSAEVSERHHRGSEH